MAYPAFWVFAAAWSAACCVKLELSDFFFFFFFVHSKFLVWGRFVCFFVLARTPRVVCIYFLLLRVAVLVQFVCGNAFLFTQLLSIVGECELLSVLLFLDLRAILSECIYVFFWLNLAVLEISYSQCSLVADLVMCQLWCLMYRFAVTRSHPEPRFKERATVPWCLTCEVRKQKQAILYAGMCCTILFCWLVTSSHPIFVCFALFCFVKPGQISSVTGCFCWWEFFYT